MDFDLDLNSENSTMTSFLELEKEIEEVPFFPDSVVRPSVMVKPRPKPATVQPSLTDIMSSCGIEYDLPEDCNASSPSSIHSDIQLEQNNELIDQLEEFFIKTEGKPTVVEDESVSNGALSTTLVTPDGQNVIIIIAPSSPTESVPTTNQDTSDSDPEWTPSPAPISPSQVSLLATGYQEQARPRKKAQNRTAAFRYREKKKSEQDLADEELEALEDKNIRLKEKLTEMETEFKYLKKLMGEAGLGRYTLAVNY